jgi:hypothetical protein
MIVINMPGGAIQYIKDEELLWFRKAFEWEWKGAVMVRLSDDRIYSRESVDELSSKFLSAGLPIAELTPPDSRIKLFINGNNVRQVVESDPVIFHDKAKSVLVFSDSLKLAVREELDEAKVKIERAVKLASVPA